MPNAVPAGWREDYPFSGTAAVLESACTSRAATLVDLAPDIGHAGQESTTRERIIMPFSIYEASVPVFAKSLTNVAAWLDKTLAEGGSEAALMQARLAPDMRPFPAQIQFASDSAKGAIARLTGHEAPAMADTEASFAELQERCQRTVDTSTALRARQWLRRGWSPAGCAVR
jgi:hypothetical protein